MYSAKYEHSYTDITTLDDYQAFSTVKLEQVNISVSNEKSIPFLFHGILCNCAGKGLIYFLKILQNPCIAWKII